ncbi:glycosyltransferase family 9 protein [Candidatus Poribacteria bacterium]|nr:glycosyltransferase family 9 protein [Candidatus Poribacteria bacterium]
MKVLVFSTTSGIGDMIMTVPMLKLLRRRIPHAHIVLGVLPEGARQLFETCPYVDEVRKVETDGVIIPDLIMKNARLLWRMMRDYKFDICITTSVSYASFYMGIDNIIARFMRAKRRVGYLLPASGALIWRALGFSFLLHERLRVDPAKHHVLQNIELLKFIGIEPEGEIPGLELWPNEEDERMADGFLKVHGIKPSDLVIGIHPGGNVWVMKRWPARRFAKLIDKIVEEYPGAKVLIFGGLEEEGLKRKVAEMAGGDPIPVDTMPIRATAALIRRCDLFVANDSAPMHMAAAMGTPVLGIFGPTNPQATGPFSRKGAVVSLGLKCQPCYNKVGFFPNMTCNAEPEYACLRELPVQKVFEKVVEMLR